MTEAISGADYARRRMQSRPLRDSGRRRHILEMLGAGKISPSRPREARPDGKLRPNPPFC